VFRIEDICSEFKVTNLIDPKITYGLSTQYGELASDALFMMVFQYKTYLFS
jgi:hypothetical protein